ncbi:MAG: glycogen/starch/alpha-glucan family phosphorylase [Parachlamydiaceae bacterium]|nr:glycogen/starch/alpha-glucan family phosphorylase [Parachlamydiaceae bacterium]
MAQVDVDYQAEMLVAKIKHYLITTMGRVSDEATPDEFYRALAYALREEIMINWLACARTREQRDVRMVYYLSMEYLPGRMLTNNLSNLSATELVGLVLQKMNRSLGDVIACELDPGLGNGGLGRLASCLLDALATHDYPAQAYGLRYHYGTFEQQIWNGMQIEAPDRWLLNENPWEFRRDARKAIVKYCGTPIAGTNIHGDEIQLLKDYEEVSALPFDIPVIGYSKNQRFSVVTLRLWTTKESPRNFQLQRYNAGSLGQAAENVTLSDVLYPSDQHDTGKRIRLKQEFLLVSASLQDIIRRYLAKHDNFRLFADKVRIQVNDTHATLVIPELIRILTKHYDIPWKMAVEITQTCVGYTNHTVLKEALEEWDQNLLRYLLPRQTQIIQRLNLDFCNQIRSKYPSDEDRVRRMSIIEYGKVRMANLAIFGSARVNGVAALHTEILKKSVFKEFAELYPDRFVNVTNGVTQRRWLLQCNPDLARFITKRIGDAWITDFSHIQELAKFASDTTSQDEFLAIKKKNKLRLIEFIEHENHLRSADGRSIVPPPNIDINSLFDVQIKRIHEYKRQLMNVLRLIMVYLDMLSHPDKPRVKRTVIFAGKAAAGYETAKDIIRLICAVETKINRDPEIGKFLKVLFIENYNVTRAEAIIPAADLSEQISTAGTEASGTGNMKLSINGALTIGTDDGANIEMRQSITDQWWPFAFGCSSEEVEKIHASGSYDPQAICNANTLIQRAVNALRDRTFATNDDEHLSFSDLYHQLMESHYGGSPDRFLVLKDLESYYHTQEKVDELFQQPNLWAEYAIHNIAGMGKFTIDRSVMDYCELIWKITPCPADDEILARVRHEYELVDQCRIY